MLIAIVLLSLVTIGSTILGWRVTKKLRHKFVDKLSDETLNFWACMPFALVFMPFVFMTHFPLSMILLIPQAGCLFWQILCSVLYQRRIRRPIESGGGSCSYTFNTKEKSNG